MGDPRTQAKAVKGSLTLPRPPHPQLTRKLTKETILQSSGRAPATVAGNPEALKRVKQRQTGQDADAVADGEVKIPHRARKSHDSTPKAPARENDKLYSERRKPGETSARGKSDYQVVALEQGGKEQLCRTCKSTTPESICFIGNDGRIAACSTGASARQLHFCNAPRCAANPNYRPPSAPAKKFLVSKRRLVPSQHAKSKSDAVSDCLGAHSRVGGSRMDSSLADGLRQAPSPACLEHKQNTTNDGQISVGMSPVDQNVNSPRSVFNSDTGGMFAIDQYINPPRGVLNSDTGGILLPMDQYTNPPRCAINSVDEWLEADDQGQRREFEFYGGTSTAADVLNGGGTYGFPPPEDDSSPIFVRGYGKAQEASGCSTPGENCASTDGDHEKSYTDEGGELGSGCSTPVEQAIGSASLCRSSFHQRGDELSCSDGNRTAEPGMDDFPSHDSEQSGAKLQGRRSNMSRLRRNYLSFLKQEEQEEGETVRLRKQEIEERKQAGDWMLDCAIEEVLHKLAPNGETRVKVLVEAFETVISHSDSETHHEHNLHASHPVTMHC